MRALKMIAGVLLITQSVCSGGAAIAQTTPAFDSKKPSSAFEEGLRAAGAVKPAMNVARSAQQSDREWNIDVETFMTTGLGANIARDHETLVAFDKVVRAVTSDPANANLSNQAQLEKAYFIYKDMGKDAYLAPQGHTQSESESLLNAIIKKWIGAAGASLLVTIFMFRHWLVVHIKNMIVRVVAYFSIGGMRIINVTIVFAVILFAWMFRNEHMDKYMFRNRFTGEIFDSRE